MDFTNIDDYIKNYGKDDSNNDGVQEKLDEYDIEKLRSIYSRVVGKRPDLLKRHHLCQEILKAYESWVSNKLKNKTECENIEIIRLSSLLSLKNRSSFRTFNFSLGQSIENNEFTLFNVGDKLEFYQKCTEELVFRSSLFSKLTIDSVKNPEKLLNLYFSHLYQGYRDIYCDFLTICVVGINLFQYQIVDLSFEKNTIKIKYDKSTSSLGYFHLDLPNFTTKDIMVMSTPTPTTMHNDTEKNFSNIIEIQSDCFTTQLQHNQSKSDTLDMSHNLNEIFNYSDNWVYFDQFPFKFTIIDPKSHQCSMREEIFSSLAC